MAYDSLREFIDRLEKAGELVRVAEEVDPELEITEIADRTVKAGGPALVFERVKGSDMPVAINLMGSRRRMAWALGVDDVEQIAARIEELIKPEIPDSWLGKIKMIPTLARLASIPPKIVSSGPCQDVVHTGDDVDLGRLPVLKCWPDDAGRFVTLGAVFTKHRETGERNVGMYRLQVMGPSRTGMHWHPHHDGAQHHRDYREAGERMPVAVSLGGDPCYAYMATAPLPPRTDECLFGGFVRGKPVPLVKCRTVDMEAPADAEIVLEGYVEPNETTIEGPFGDHTGFYSPADAFPIFHVTAITHRRSPVYPTTIVGTPPMEDTFMGKATERIFMPLVRMFVPEVVDINLPVSGVFHNLAMVGIKKTYPTQARKVMQALWGLGQLMFTKIIVVVDADVDVHDEDAVWFHVGANVHPGRDVCFVEGPTDILDHAAPVEGVGHKMGIDATRKLPEEGHPRGWPAEIRMADDVVRLVTQRWQRYGIPLRDRPDTE